MPPPSEIPDNLAAIYNYESAAGISLNKHSTNVIAYESEAKNGNRFVLFSDGRIEQITDKQLAAVGVDADPKTAKERSEKQAARDSKEMDDFLRKFQDRMEKEEKDREESTKREREQTDREVQKAREEKETKRKEFEDEQKKQREQSEQSEKKKDSMATVHGPSKPAAGSNKSLPNPKADIGAALRQKVSLKAPYRQSYLGAPTDRISMQNAVADILKQVGVEYDLEKSRANLGDLARRWVTPNITGESCEAALVKLLRPLGCSYNIENGKLVLKRK
jgi:hypothetical protein